MPKFAAAIDTMQIPVKGLTPESSGTAPATPVPFQLWGDTGAGKLKWRTPGGAWMAADDVADGAITDAKVAASAGISLSKLAVNPLQRANHTGSQPASTISDLAGVVQAYRLDQFAAPTGPLNAGGQRITNGAAPIQPTDFVTRAFMEQAVADARAGIAGVKDPVRAVAQANVDLAAPGATIDGIALNVGERFLAPNQTTPNQNGIYEYRGAATPAVRAADADATGEILDGTIVAVGEGTDKGKQYIQTAEPAGAPGSWSQIWTVYNTSGTSYGAGAGMVLTGGNTFDIVAADGSITVAADSITVGLVPVAKGGTGATTAAAARTNLATLTQYAAAAPALTAGVAANIVHSLGTEDVQIYVREAAGKGRVFLDEAVVDANTISLRSDIAWSAAALRVTVQARA